MSAPPLPACTLRCPAKINLTLRVLGVRADGLHELESLVAQIDLCDELSITPQEDGRYWFDCDDPTLPDDGSNLVLQAARALARAAGINRGADFVLKKRIPAGAGLGGGSSDAAATLRALNTLWGLNLPNERLHALAATLGSDVPLFLGPPLCVIRGRGEIVEPVEPRLDAWCVLALPGIHCATPAVYRAWDRLASNRASAESPAPTAGKPLSPALSDVLAVLDHPSELMTRLANDLEPAAFTVAPELETLHARAADIAGGPVRMSGSGSALFRLVGSRAQAEALAGRLRDALGVRVEVARTLNSPRA